MPEEKRQWLGLSETDWNAFIRWFSNTYGFWKSVTTTGEALRPYIAEWQSRQKPTAEEWLASQEKKRIAGLSPSEKAEELGTGPFLTKDYPDEPYPLGLGFKWVKTSFDETGTPIQEQWVKQPIAKVEPAGEKRIEVLNGVLGLATYENGKLTDFEPFPASVLPEIKGLTDYQRAQLGFSERGQALEERKQELSERELAFRMAQEDPELQRRIDEAKWEKLKQDILGSLTGPADWITRWQLERKENPFRAPVVREPPRIVYADEVMAGRLPAPQDIFIGTLKEAIAAGFSQFIPPELFNQAVQPSMPGPEPGAEFGVTPAEQHKRELEMLRGAGFNVPADIEQATRGFALGQGTDLFRGGTGFTTGVTEARQAGMAAAALPSTPPAPSWLPQFAPGQVAGRPITPERLPPPSFQQLTVTDPTKIAALSGFAQFSGQDWGDLLRKAEIMLPSSPSLGRRRRTPISQRTGAA